MFIGSLADESGWKWMTAPKGLPGIIAKRTHSGKSGCIADEADASRTPNALSVLNTLYTRCIRLHPFYFRATNDV